MYHLYYFISVFKSRVRASEIIWARGNRDFSSNGILIRKYVLFFFFLFWTDVRLDFSGSVLCNFGKWLIFDQERNFKSFVFYNDVEIGDGHLLFILQIL